MAQRDEKGLFVKGNTVGTAPRNTAPRTTSQYFKKTVDLILDKIPLEDVVARMYEMPPEAFVYCYTKLLDMQIVKDNNEFKAELEKIKLEKDSDDSERSEHTITISFKEDSEDPEDTSI